MIHKTRRIRVEGREACYPARFPEDYQPSVEEEIASLIDDVLHERRRIQLVKPHLLEVMDTFMDDVKIVRHAPVGSTRCFSVWAPRELVHLLRKTYGKWLERIDESPF